MALEVMALKLILGAVIGGGLGFAFYKFVGCASGACPLTSDPIITPLYGALVGVLVAASFR